MSTHYYIDGYNVIYKSAQLRPAAQRDIEEARDALVEKTAAFCAATGRRVTIVFDGRAKHLPEPCPRGSAVPGLDILYSPAALSADAVIERLIYRSENRLDTVVVSNDRGLRDLCRGMGALTMDAANFLRETRDVQLETTNAFHARNREGAATSVLEDLLDASARERLGDLRKRL